ncbi:hypothetical protein GCM10007377_09620 [Galliscardovia ingluviei]|uniref:Sensor-like histidine kinase SenX3 n=2 Tax=Galliscardovia ingluviei TaxID=1769422 RepID=A0A8J3AJW9_9BIFI|nr:hypothetical protein GCM10007377_09620 [Galliscardovia ingluviei]
MIQRSNDAICVADVYGEIVFVNDSAKQIELLAQNRVLHDGLLQVMQALENDYVERGACQWQSMQIKQPVEGTQGLLLVQVLNLGFCGFERLCAIVARDVRDQHQLDTMQKDLISNLSHELKTPIGAISLLAETLADVEDDTEAVHYFSSRILRESRRLQDLVAQILDISRSSSQRAESNLSANVGDSNISVDAGIDVYYGTAGGVDVLAESGESAPLGGNVEHSNSVLSNVDACNCKEVVGEVCNAVQVIQQAIDDSAVQAQAKHIHVVFTCVEDGHPVGLRRTADDTGQHIAGQHVIRQYSMDDDSCRWIVAIRAQDLRTIVANIVNNAIAYSAPYTTVSISVESDTEKYGDCIAIRVVDLGDGIPKEDTMRVFERFYRVDPARSRNTGGSGLGLAIVKQLVEQAGGRVDLWSRLGEGTTVTVLLPCAV